MPTLTKPINAVTVSIIAQILMRPCVQQNDCSLAQSKRFTAGFAERVGVMI
jgi:hypothetical protein